MSTRYGHDGPGGGTQDQAERKDEGWRSRQGGAQARRPGRRTDKNDQAGPRDATAPPPGTNTQGELAGIDEASDRSAARLDDAGNARVPAQRESGTDQPPRMGGPLGPDRQHPHLPEGAQTSESQGSGAGGFDRGVNAKAIGEVHQGSKVEDPRDAGPAE